MTKQKWSHKTGDLFTEFSIQLKYSERTKRGPFNTGDCLIEVTIRAGLTVYSEDLAPLR